MTEWSEEQLIDGVRTALRRSTEGYFEAGLWLDRAKETRSGKSWLEWLSVNFGISEGYASRLMSVARSKPLSHAKPEELPQDLTVLYSLSRIDPDALQEAMSAGTVRRGMSRDEARDLAVRHGSGKPRKKNAGPSAAQLKHQAEELAKALDRADRAMSATLQELIADTDSLTLTEILTTVLDKAVITDLNVRLALWLEKSLAS